MVVGSILLWLALGAVLTVAGWVIVCQSLSSRPDIDAACRLLFGVIALVGAMALSYSTGAVANQRIALANEFFAWADSWLAQLGVGLPPLDALVEDFLVGLGVARLFNDARWHLALFGPPVVVVGWVVLQNLLLMLGWLVRWVSRLFGPRASAALEQLVDLFSNQLQLASRLIERHQSTHDAAFWAAVALGALGVSLPIGVTLADRALALAIMNHATEIIWVGGFIFFLELAGASRPWAVPAPAVPERERDEPPPLPARSLASLTAAYDKLSDAILLKCELPSIGEALQDDQAAPRNDTGFAALLEWLATEAEVPRASRDNLAGALAAMHDTGQALLFEETLAEPHYRVLLELIQDAQDKGGTILIVCPDGTGVEIEDALAVASRIFFIDLIRQTRVLGSGRADGNHFAHLVIAPETSFDALLTDAQALDPWRRRLSLLVVLELSRLDVALLHTRLARLFPEGPERGRQIMVQSESLGDVSTLTRSTFGLSSNQSVRSVQLHTVQWTKRIVYVFDGEVDTGRYLVRKLFRGLPAVDPLLLLFVPAWQDGWQPMHFDPSHRRDDEMRDELANTYLGPSPTLHHLVGRPPSEPSEHYLQAGPPNPVVLTDDAANLVISLGRTYAFRRLGEMFIGIVARNYPLRDMLIAKVREAKSPAELEAWHPLAPTPGIGAFELANLLLPRLCATDGVPRDLVEALMQRVPSSVLEGLGVGPNVAGIERLFALLTPRGSSPPAIERISGIPERYAILPARQVLARQLLDVHLPLLIAGQPQSVRVPRGDHGLAFAVSTFLLVPQSNGGGQFFRVATINAGGVHIAPASYRQAKYRLPPSYVFSRRYVLRLDPASIALESEDVLARPAGNRRARHLHACFERVTEGFWFEEDGGTQLDHDSAVFTQLQSQHAVERPFRSVLHVRFDEIAATSDEAPEVDAASVSLTLCVLLYDVLTSLFPRHAHRLAVVSPQAKPIYEQALGPQAERRDRMLVQRYCRLVGIGEIEAGAIELFLIEDADFDLGVVRAVRSNLDFVLKRVDSYAEWLAMSTDKPPFHAFGAKETPSWLTVEPARRYLR